MHNKGLGSVAIADTLKIQIHFILLIFAIKTFNCQDEKNEQFCWQGIYYEWS